MRSSWLLRCSIRCRKDVVVETSADQQRMKEGGDAPLRSEAGEEADANQRSDSAHSTSTIPTSSARYLLHASNGR